ncbi:MAG: sigma-70 family RNA polymerase sigma factor [Phycisphaerales bacterium]|nr:MAG: sigma-70 family RNA polymerase sigma factor [Phycisphaerales bacterium]
MLPEDPRPVTRVLQNTADGDVDMGQEILPQVYDELRRLARAKLTKIPPGQTLQATALVHEAYLRLITKENPAWDDRGRFVAAAGQAMRDILVEQARRKMALKRGGDLHRVTMDQAEFAVDPPSEEVLTIDEALRHLEKHDPHKGQIVRLRYFARMTTAETAEAMGISVGAVRYEWQYIRAWLISQVRDGDTS